jgi:hypothetical protein
MLLATWRNHGNEVCIVHNRHIAHELRPRGRGSDQLQASASSVAVASPVRAPRSQMPAAKASTSHTAPISLYRGSPPAVTFVNYVCTVHSYTTVANCFTWGMWHVWERREGCTGCWWGNLRERDHWGDPDVDGRIILKWMFRKLEGVVWTGWSWLRIGTGGGHLWVR